MMVNLKMVIKILRKKFMNENSGFTEDSDENSDDSNDDYCYEERKSTRKSSSFGENEQSRGFRRTLSRLTDGDDYEDYKGAKKMSRESYGKMINKPKVMKVRGISNASNYTEKEFFENNA